MLVAITGTPGTGKSSACSVLERRGYAVVDLDEVARKEGFVVGRDPERDADEIDVESLRERLRVPAKMAFLKGHYAHLMNVDIVVVLRCRPAVLQERLKGRGWSQEKIRENVEAEAIDVILQEAAGRMPHVFEIDATDATPGQVADTILSILQGKIAGHEAGSVDWSREVLSWF